MEDHSLNHISFVRLASELYFWVKIGDFLFAWQKWDLFFLKSPLSVWLSSFLCPCGRLFPFYTFSSFCSFFVRSFNHWNVSNTPCHVERYSSGRLLITVLRNNFATSFVWSWFRSADEWNSVGEVQYKPLLSQCFWAVRSKSQKCYQLRNKVDSKIKVHEE